MTKLLSLFLPFVALLLSPSLNAAADPVGKWHFILDTSGGDREVDAVFQLNGEKVTGKWDTTEVMGTFKDGKVDLSFPLRSEEAGTTADLKIKGTLDGDTITGNWEFSEYNGTFKATRGAAPKESPTN